MNIFNRFDYNKHHNIIFDTDNEECYDIEGASMLMNELNNTNQELYKFRLLYNALIFNNWHKHNEVEVYKSRKHSDGSIPFNDADWFVVVAILPSGKQITNHYHINYWDYFKIPVYEVAKDEFDGHTSNDVILRLTEMILNE